MLSALMKVIKGQPASDKRATELRELIRREATIGGTLFGPVPQGGRREFFCLDEHTWVWHEEWVDASGQRHAVMTRYDVRPQGIYKAQGGQPYRPLSFEEAKHFFKAVKMYQQAVKSELYRDQTYLQAIAA